MRTELALTGIIPHQQECTEVETKRILKVQKAMSRQPGQRQDIEKDTGQILGQIGQCVERTSGKIFPLTFVLSTEWNQTKA